MTAVRRTWVVVAVGFAAGCARILGFDDNERSECINDSDCQQGEHCIAYTCTPSGNSGGVGGSDPTTGGWGGLDGGSGGMGTTGGTSAAGAEPSGGGAGTAGTEGEAGTSGGGGTAGNVSGGAAGAGGSETTGGTGGTGGGTTSKLAYVCDGELRLYDAMLDSDVWVSSSSSATDFEFSPDGRFLAYRVGSDPARLMLLSSPNWDEEALDFEQGSVLAYEWSPDSSVLAVAYTTSSGAGGAPSTETRLGGIRVAPGPGCANGGAGGVGGAGCDGGLGAGGAGGVGSVVELSSTEVKLDSGSDLTWFDDGQSVAYFESGSSGGTSYSLNYSQFNGIQFTTQTGYTGMLPPTSPPYIVPSRSGFFSIEGVGVYFIRADDGSGALFAHSGILAQQYNPAFVAPSGRYTAHIAPDASDAASAHINTPQSAPQNPVEIASGCVEFLSWARDRDRFACVGSDGILVFDVDATNGLIAFDVSGLSSFTNAHTADRRRAFSRAGDWFAFVASDDRLYTAEVDDDELIVQPIPENGFEVFSDSHSIDLTFSPDGRWLLRHEPAGLFLHQLDRLTPSSYPVSSGPFASSDDCRAHSYLSAPDAWCGTAGTTTPSAWSPDSEWVVFVTSSDDETGELQLLTPQEEPQATPTLISGPCHLPYTFAFQPQPRSMNNETYR